jgi:hypothetical protein
MWKRLVETNEGPSVSYNDVVGQRRGRPLSTYQIAEAKNEGQKEWTGIGSFELCAHGGSKLRGDGGNGKWNCGFYIDEDVAFVAGG